MNEQLRGIVGRGFAVGLGFVILVTPVAAQVVPRHHDALEALVQAPAGFVATAAPEPLVAVQTEVSPALLAAVASFEQDHGTGWRYFVDRRSGALALAEGNGVAWIPGAGNELDPVTVVGTGPGGSFSVADMEQRGRQFIAAYNGLFGVDGSQLVLDERGTRRFGETGQFWQIAFGQRVGGVPVAHSRIVLRVSHGNLVQFGATHVWTGAPQGHVTPALSAGQARAALALYSGDATGTDLFSNAGELEWVLRGSGDEVGYSGAHGQGWQPALAYRLAFERPGQIGTWEALVDADEGDVLRFVDANAYDSLVKASVYTVTNCADSLSCVPGSAGQVTVTMPFTSLNFVGGICSGDDCYTNSVGAFAYPPGAVAASTSLEGKYFRIVDDCGAIAASAAAPGDIDLGTTPPDNSGLNTDCQPATQESQPGTGPTSGGTGDTHAARSTFYHLNLINQKSRSYLPDNDWLRGADGSAGPVPTDTNGPPACNAFWQGTTGALVFFRSTPVLNCNNFGEVPDIFLHEFGHGLDSNDGSGSAPEGGTGEAMGDTFALLQGQDSCIGEGAFIGSLAGYGSQSNRCSGVRDLDYTRFCNPAGGGDGCRATPLDPDAPRGSRSGNSPVLTGPDAGTPARWNHMIEAAAPGVADGQSNFYDCGGPETTGCAGALNHGCHCESLIGSQANWDLSKAIITAEFGGDIYANPPGATEVSGWQYMDRLWYLTRDLASSSYSVAGGTTNGCAAVNWYSTYRFIDDDDGNLANGTPHADLIFSAMDLHAMACGSGGDATNQATACPPPPAAPVLTTCGTESPIQLDWTASPGASEYRILRNTLGCEFGFSPVTTVDGAQRFFEDAEVAPGIPYYYSVQPVGVSRSCYGQASNCLAVTPTRCGAVALPAPDNVSLATPADNTIHVSWDAVGGAGAYKVSRRKGTCAEGEPFVAIGSVAAPETAFTDTIALQGTLTYAYRVAAAETACTACTSDPSTCVEVQASGSCGAQPLFAGLEEVRSDPESQCQLRLEWSAATPVCGSAVAYDVFRSTLPSFAPGPDNRLVSGVTGTSYTDLALAGDVRYYYVVRAVDEVGNTESNLARKSGISGGELAPGTYADDAGDSGAAKFAPAPDPGNTWAIRLSGTGNATRHYATSETGPYPNVNCLALESNEITLGSNPSLSFRSRFAIEQTWDGGIVEVSTASGGFSDWSKLDSVNYPGAMAGITEVCAGNPGLSDGQLAFNGVSNGWESFGGSLLEYAGERIKLRFLFGSDDATNDEGWFIDDLEITDALVPESCLPEVSPKGSAHPLLIGKEPGGTLTLVFEDLGAAADAYNVYEGEIGNWFSHQPGVCHVTTSQAGVPGAGKRTLTGYTPSGNSSYVLINGVTPSAEGVLGFRGNGVERPMLAPECGPLP